ncbi:MAG: hypothetical protein ABGZ36_21380 [Actinomycetota bacterium]
MNPEPRHHDWPFHPHLRFLWGAVLLLAVLAAACAEDGVVPEPRSGVVFAVNLERGYFVLDDTPADDHVEGNGFDLPPLWIDRDNTVHTSGVPNCLEVGQEVTVGVVKTAPTDVAPGIEIAAWLSCQ